MCTSDELDLADGTALAADPGLAAGQGSDSGLAAGQESSVFEPRVGGCPWLLVYVCWRLDTATAWSATARSARAWLVTARSASMRLLVLAAAPGEAAAATAAPQVAPGEAAAATARQCNTVAGFGPAAVHTLEPAYPELAGTALGAMVRTSLGLRSASDCSAHPRTSTRSAHWRLESQGVALLLEAWPWAWPLVLQHLLVRFLLQRRSARLSRRHWSCYLGVACWGCLFPQL